MIPTLQLFTRALLTPDLSFATLADASAATDSNGLPCLLRTTRFVEAHITWQGAEWLLSMPLSPAAMHHAERTVAALRRINSPWLTQQRILAGELRWSDASQKSLGCDLLLEQLPAGCDFAQAPTQAHRDTLITALNALEAELERIGVSHNNLKASNLRWSGGRFIPLRWHDARTGGATDADRTAFEALRRAVAEASGGDLLCDITAPYTAASPLTGHLWVGNLHEGLICVEDQTGYGFVDAQNRPVIDSQFLWAGDFHEGRAEVQTPQGMGLIDRTGAYILPACYEIVDYDYPESIVRVRQNGLWAHFDYLGGQITAFGTENE